MENFVKYEVIKGFLYYMYVLYIILHIYMYIPMHTHCEYFTLNENLDKHNILHEVASFSL